MGRLREPVEKDFARAPGFAKYLKEQNILAMSKKIKDIQQGCANPYISRGSKKDQPQPFIVERGNSKTGKVTPSAVQFPKGTSSM